MKAELNLARFKSNVRKGVPDPGRAGVRKSTAFLIDHSADNGRRKQFIISTGAVDHDNDTIAVKGWKLDAYIRSPVVFFNHQSYGYPIGKTVEIGIEKGELRATVEFMPADMPDGAGETAEACFRMVSEQYLCSASVGFKPLEFTTAKDRMEDDDWWPALDFTSQVLLEWSVVGIPANPEANAVDDERAAVVELQKTWQDERDAKAAAAAAEIERALAYNTHRKLLRNACY